MAKRKSIFKASLLEILLFGQNSWHPKTLGAMSIEVKWNLENVSKKIFKINLV